MSEHIADSRYKKIIKLSHVSKNIIKEFGFLYFLSVATKEARKQKWKLFAIDKPPRIFNKPFSEYDKYELLKKKHEITKEKKLKLKDNQSKFNFKPTISLILYPINEKEIEFVEETISSIKNQVYEDWELHIIGEKTNHTLWDRLNKTILDDNRIITNKLDDNQISSVNKIISSSKGDYIAFFGLMGKLTVDALHHVVSTLNSKTEVDLIYTDEDEINNNKRRTSPFFKPNWSPYLFLSMDYISSFFVLKKSIFDQCNGYRDGYEDSKNYDLLLRCTEKTKKIFHIPLILFSVIYRSEKFQNNIKSLQKCISDSLARRGIQGTVEEGLVSNTIRVKYQLIGNPKVSIIIPTKDKKKLLERCIKSLEKKTNYKNWEIIIVDNGSEKEETKSYLKSLPYNVVEYNQPFNFSAMNNIAASKANGDYILFLNDDTAALEPNWLKEMLSICSQNDVGVVGAKLLLSDDTVQHAGITFLKNGAGFHPYQNLPSNESGYFGFLNVIREYSAVTGACLLIKKEVFKKVNQFDEKFDLYYGDSDLCLKVSKLGYSVVYTPFAFLRHDGSSKIKEYATSFFTVENYLDFKKKWISSEYTDPYYNPNLGWNYKIN